MARKKGNKKKIKNKIEAGDVNDGNADSQKNFKIEKSDLLGRYLVAVKEINAGEVILVDEPIIVGPCQESKPVCLGCYSRINTSSPNAYFRCSICTWPLCSKKCSGLGQKHGHDQYECDVLSKSFVPYQSIDSFSNFYYALAPFRCLLEKKKGSKEWEILRKMETHSNERKKNLKLWESNKKLAANVIRKIWGLTEFTEEDVHFACGVLEINAFEITITDSEPLRALYPNAFLFAHDCVPNTCRSNDSRFRLMVRAIANISTDEIISINYSYTLQSTLRRRKHLQETKFFECSCKRCSDPTELGTYAGAIKCTKCNQGLILPENPLDNNSLWKCMSSECDKDIEASQIIPVLDGLFEEFDSINGNDIEGYEKFLEKYEIILHPNHYLRLSALYNLCLLYGKIDGYLINDLNLEQLERKVEICKILLNVFEKLEPGFSKQKGILLYELQAPLMVLLKKKFETQNLPKKEMKLKIKEILSYLEESHLILSKEPENSPEEGMAKAAKEAITSLKEWQSLLQ